MDKAHFKAVIELENSGKIPKSCKYFEKSALKFNGHFKFEFPKVSNI